MTTYSILRADQFRVPTTSREEFIAKLKCTT